MVNADDVKSIVVSANCVYVLQAYVEMLLDCFSRVSVSVVVCQCLFIFGVWYVNLMDFFCNKLACVTL